MCSTPDRERETQLDLFQKLAKKILVCVYYFKKKDLALHLVTTIVLKWPMSFIVLKDLH